jgi:hypothetical protein
MINKSLNKWLIIIIILFISFIIIPIIFKMNEGFVDPIKINGVKLNPTLHASEQVNKNLKEVATNVYNNQGIIYRNDASNAARIINADKTNSNDSTKAIKTAIKDSLDTYSKNNPDVNTSLTSFSGLINALSGNVSSYNTKVDASHADIIGKIDTTDGKLDDMNSRLLDYNTANMAISENMKTINGTMKTTNQSYLDKTDLLQGNYDNIQEKLNSFPINEINTKLAAYKAESVDLMNNILTKLNETKNEEVLFKSQVRSRLKINPLTATNEEVV